MEKHRKAAPAAGSAEARAFAEKLSARTDALNAAIGRAEEHLASLRYGVEAQVILAGSDDDDAVFDLLRFAKYGKEWRLLFVVVDADDKTEEVVPLVNASRATRLLAASRIKDIEPALRAKLAEEVDNVDNAIAAIDDFVGVAS